MPHMIFLRNKNVFVKKDALEDEFSCIIICCILHSSAIESLTPN